jgi:hypothetical protein
MGGGLGSSFMMEGAGRPILCMALSQRSIVTDLVVESGSEQK